MKRRRRWLTMTARAGRRCWARAAARGRRPRRGARARPPRRPPRTPAPPGPAPPGAPGGRRAASAHRRRP